MTLTTLPAEIPAFDTWVGTGAGGKGLTGAADAFDADPDHDRIPNGIEFVIGGEPNPANPLSNSLALLPTVEASGNNLVFTFTRRDEAAYLNPVVEFTTDLSGPWTTAGAGRPTAPTSLFRSSSAASVATMRAPARTPAAGCTLSGHGTRFNSKGPAAGLTVTCTMALVAVP